MSEPKLKPCPFCGGVPTGCAPYSPDNTMIIDHLQGCYLAPETKPKRAFLYKNLGDWETWNRRAK